MVDYWQIITVSRGTNQRRIQCEHVVPITFVATLTAIAEEEFFFSQFNQWITINNGCHFLTVN
jgi:hypothetical protein